MRADRQEEETAPPQTTFDATTSLPEGWTVARLADGLVLDVQPGFACGVHNSAGVGTPHLRPMNVNEDGKIDLGVLKYVPKTVSDGMQRWIERGTILFNNTNSPELVGKTAYYDEMEPRAFSNHMTRIRSNPTVLNARYCARVLHHYWRTGYFAAHCNNHVSQASIDRKQLLSTRVPLPPLPEQQRIVDALEISLGKLSTCRNRLGRVPIILSRFRQAVLAAACSGRLTEDWRESSSPEETAEQLLTRIIEERMTDSRMRRAKAEPHRLISQDADEDLPRSWTITSVGQVTRNHDGKRVPLKADDRRNRRGLYPYFGASGVIDSIDGYLFEGEYLLIAEDGANLLSRSTPIAFQANGQFWVNNHAHVVQTYGGVPLAYLELFLNGLDLQHFVTGTAQPKLTQEALNGISVPLPPVREQEEIVRRVGALFRLADGIERRVVLGGALSDKLTQSLLARAFRGALVPTEAELAAKEGREYETAEELLARVRATGDGRADGSASVSRGRNSGRSRSHRNR